MSVQVLVSTMNQANIKSLVKEMKINSYIIINQVTKDIKPPVDYMGVHKKYYSFKEKGLSKSRNKAIVNATSDICAIADDDMYYVDNYENIVADAYKKYPNADIITFHVDSNDINQKKNLMKEGRLGLLQTMKIASWQITFKRRSILESSIKLDEDFGTGTDNYMGEENIFLFDCHKKGLKIYYLPHKIATLNSDSVSTWFCGYDKKYFYVKGKVFCRMSTVLSLFLILQFALRKRKLYKNDTTMISAIDQMIKGAILEYREARAK